MPWHQTSHSDPFPRPMPRIIWRWAKNWNLKEFGGWGECGVHGLELPQRASSTIRSKSGYESHIGGFFEWLSFILLHRTLLLTRKEILLILLTSWESDLHTKSVQITYKERVASKFWAVVPHPLGGTQLPQGPQATPGAAANAETWPDTRISRQARQSGVSVFFI